MDKGKGKEGAPVGAGVKSGAGMVTPARGDMPVHDALRLYRVRDWLHFLPLPLATVDPRAPLGAMVWDATRGVATAAAVLAFGYLLNTLADRQMDLDARKNPLIVPGAAEPRTALALLLVASLLLAALGPRPVWIATAVSLFFFSIYSAAPRIKTVPIVGSLANIGMFAPLLLLGLRDEVLPAGIAALVVACGALVLENQLVHEAADEQEDRGGGVRTTWLTVGPRRTAAIAALCGVAASAGAASLGGSAALLLGAAAAAVFAVAVPLSLSRLQADAATATRLRMALRWSGLAFGAALLMVWRMTG